MLTIIAICRCYEDAKETLCEVCLSPWVADAAHGQENTSTDQLQCWVSEVTALTA
jgi:hypothetical protein